MRVLSVLLLVFIFSASLLGQTSRAGKLDPGTEPAKGNPPKRKVSFPLPPECRLVLQITDIGTLTNDELGKVSSRLDDCVMQHGNAMTKADLKNAFTLGQSVTSLLVLNSMTQAMSSQQAEADQLRGACTQVVKENENLVNRYNKLAGDYNGLLTSYHQRLDSDMALYNYLATTPQQSSSGMPVSAWRRALQGGAQALQNSVAAPTIQCTSTKVGNSVQTECR